MFGRLGAADLASGLVAIVLGAVGSLHPSAKPEMSELIWQFGAGIFVIWLGARFLLAPYWIYREQKKTIDRLEGTNKLKLIFAYSEPYVPKTDTSISNPYCVGIKNMDPQNMIHNAEVCLTGNFIGGNISRRLRLLGQDRDIVDIPSGKVEMFEVSYLNDQKNIVLCFIDRNEIPSGKYRVKIKAYGQGTGAVNGLFSLKVNKKGRLEFTPRLKKIVEDHSWKNWEGIG